MSPLTDDDISWLLNLLTAEELAEVEIESQEEGWRVRVARTTATVVPLAAAPAGAVAASVAGDSAQQLPEDVVPVLASMTGTFYRAPSPEAPPYVEEGDEVERGQVLGLIEAMKVFNELESPVSGKIEEILVDNEQAVKADERLMLIRLKRE